MTLRDRFSGREIERRFVEMKKVKRSERIGHYPKADAAIVKQYGKHSAMMKRKKGKK
jgi:hypothetical protein